ncbi:hypothetical protein DDE83_004262 [Stemphylium lycopersici]|uniref:Uncharacterized protein n=1 Tax=Stemphylium lycopersici TaxID=183478 RepID=A0A364N4V8_STELY|nr:hypothetical protein DDE83_004262 [Stemphylium lycopersici]
MSVSKFPSFVASSRDCTEFCKTPPRLMRRPPVACRRAVQSLQSPAAQPIWISDDLLTLALNRFFRSSCPHQKRHGSHVPGPLEARRRAAKRRMTVSAGFYPQDNFPSLLNLGALFGFRKDSQPTWRYEAPSLQHHSEPLDPPNNHIPSLPLSQPGRIPAEHVGPTTTTTHPFAFPNSFAQKFPQIEATTTKESAEPGTNDVDQSSVDILAHFDDFKSKVAAAQDLSSAERSRLLAETWRSCRPFHDDAWVYNAMVVEHVGKLGWDPTSILCQLKYFVVPSTYTEENLKFLNCLESLSARFPHASRAYHRVYMKVAETAKSAEASKSPSQDAKLLYIIRLAVQGAILRDKEIKHSVAETLAVVADKVQDSNVKKLLHSVLGCKANVQHTTSFLLVRAATDERLCSVIQQVLSCLPRERLEQLVSPMTLSFANAVARKTSLSGETYRDRLSAWLTVLEGLGARPRQPAFLDAAIAVITKHVFTSGIPGRMRAQLLLHALTFRLADQRTDAALRERMLHLIYSPAPSATLEQEQIRFDVVLGLILARMQRAALPHTAMINMTVDLLIRHEDLHSLYSFLLALKDHNLTLRNPSSIRSLATKNLASLQQQPISPDEATRQRHAFTLHTCQSILDLLDRPNTTSAAAHTQAQVLRARQEFAHILSRARQNHALPLIYANTTTDIDPGQRTILIHQLAHHYSLTTSRSHRETWRAIYYLYHHLESHALSIGPLFTKAVVRASIIRPMMEHRFISARRLIWVCQLVARVEGEAVARQVEAGYWRWRGELIRHAKRVKDRAGGDVKEKALVGRMKGLGLI